MHSIRIPTITKNATLNIALDTISKKKQTLIFTNSKRSAEKTAEEISKKILGVDQSVLADKILKVSSSPTQQCKRLSTCVRKGIAFHHAGLLAKQRELIEDNRGSYTSLTTQVLEMNYIAREIENYLISEQSVGQKIIYKAKSLAKRVIGRPQYTVEDLFDAQRIASHIGQIGGKIALQADVGVVRPLADHAQARCGD